MICSRQRWQIGQFTLSFFVNNDMSCVQEKHAGCAHHLKGKPIY